jgi:hypothetical protein
VCVNTAERRDVCVSVQKKHEEGAEKFRGERRNFRSTTRQLKNRKFQAHNTGGERKITREIRFKVKRDTTQEYTTREGRGREKGENNFKLKRKHNTRGKLSAKVGGGTQFNSTAPSQFNSRATRAMTVHNTKRGNTTKQVAKAKHGTCCRSAAGPKCGATKQVATVLESPSLLTEGTACAVEQLVTCDSVGQPMILSDAREAAVIDTEVVVTYPLLCCPAAAGPKYGATKQVAAVLESSSLLMGEGTAFVVR